MNWVQRKWQWAMGNKLFWWNIVLIGMTGAIICLWRSPGESDFRVKTMGMVLQLIGVGTVWFDLTSAARSFGKSGMFPRTWTWLKAGVGSQQVITGMVASSSAGCSSSARITVRWPMDSEADSSMRLATLEKNFGKIEEDIMALFNQMDQHMAMANDRATQEANARSQAVAEVRRELVEVSAGNFPVLVFGAVWLAVGVVLSTWATEIAKLAAGDWRSVLSVM